MDNSITLPANQHTKDLTRLLLIHFAHTLAGTNGQPLRPGAITWLGRIARELPFELLYYGRGATSHEVPFHALVALMEGEGIRFTEVINDDSDHLTKMLARYSKQGFDLAASYVVGNGTTPLAWAHEAGCRTIRFSDKTDRFSSLTAPGWEEVYRFLKGRPRYVALNRSSAHADVRITLDLDGQGKCFIDTGLAWADKHLALLAEEAAFDLDLRMKPEETATPDDLADDLALAFGMAFSRASRMSTSLESYGYTVPFAGALAQLAVSLKGEPQLHWKGTPNGEEAKMCHSFLSGICKYAPCTLHITSQGQAKDQLEATFRALGSALAMAVKPKGTTT